MMGPNTRTAACRWLVSAGIVLAVLAPHAARAQAGELLPGVRRMALWPADHPGAAVTSLTVFEPQPGKGNGTAAIVAPGGAYLNLASNLEGRQVANWLNSLGITAFVLQYRLGAGNPYPAPLEDAQRAIRLVRSRAGEFHLRADRIGMVGFSAGGHLAAETGVAFHAPGAGSSGDDLGAVSDRPDFLVLGYAWLNAMQPKEGHFITYCSVMPSLDPAKCRQWQTTYTPALHVTSQTPPTFLYATTDDDTVPASASVAFYQALLAAHVPAEMHLFRHGGHGSGLGEGDASLELWPLLAENWMRAEGLLTPATTPAVK